MTGFRFGGFSKGGKRLNESGAVELVYVDREILAVAFESVCHVWSAEQFVGRKTTCSCLLISEMY